MTLSNKEQLTEERLLKILSETQAVISERNARCVSGSVEVNARLFESMLMELRHRRERDKQEPVADVVAWRKEGEARTCDIRWRRFDVAPGPLFTRPLPPGVPDGYCIMPLKLTAANGAKAALSGEFHVKHHIVCEECAGEGCESCNKEGGWEGEILIGWDTIKRIHEAAVEACALPESDNIG